MSIQNFLQILFLTITIATFIRNVCASDAKYYFAKGQIQYANQMYNYAVESLEKALQISPDYFEAANLLAKIYLEYYKDRVRALQYYVQSLGAKDTQPEIHYEVGKLYYFFIEYENAKKHLHKALNLKQLVYAHYYLILIYNEEKNYVEAFNHISMCKELTADKTSLELKNGVRAMNSNKVSLAVDYFKKALEINPAEKEAYMKLVLLYRMQKRIDTAIEILETCRKVYPKDSDVLLTLAHLCFEYKHTKRRAYYIQKAISLCNDVITQDTSQCEAYSILYQIYKLLNEVPLRDENAMRFHKCIENIKD